MGLRIAMFSWESMHSIAIGGLAPHATELAAALGRKGHEVHLFTRMGLHQPQYDLIDGVHYHRCPFEPHEDFMTMIERMNNSFVWHYGETESFLGRPFDIVHGHDWLSVHSIKQAKNTHHRPVVLTIHSTEFGRCGNTYWDDPMSERIRRAEWEGTYIADRVICVSQALGREVQAQDQVPADKVRAIYNGVHVKHYDANVDIPALRRHHRIGMDEPFVLFAGRLTWQKGPDLLLEAIPRVLSQQPKSKIVFAGDGDMRAGLETRATRMGLKESTRFLGHQQGATLMGLFKSADVVCVPSRNEPFGIVILEAWSARKPVVATTIGGPAEFVRDDYNGVKVAAEPESIGNGLRKLLSDPAGSDRMGRNGRKDAETRFSWDNAATLTEQAYLEVLAGYQDGVARAATKELDMSDRNLKRNRNGGDSSSATKNQIVSSKSAMMTTVAGFEPTQEQIRQRAYEIYLARGTAPGDPVADWIQAESELRGNFVTAQKLAKANCSVTPKSVAPAPIASGSAQSARTPD